MSFLPKFLGKIEFRSILNLFELINAKCKIIEGYPDAESAKGKDKAILIKGITLSWLRL